MKCKQFKKISFSTFGEQSFSELGHKQGTMIQLIQFNSYIEFSRVIPITIVCAVYCIWLQE